MAGGSRFRVTPAAAPEQPEIKQLLNALSPRGPLPNLSSDQLPKDTHQVSGLSGSVWCTPSLVVWDLARPKRFENRRAASVSRPFRPKPTPEDPRAGWRRRSLVALPGTNSSVRSDSGGHMLSS